MTVVHTPKREDNKSVEKEIENTMKKIEKEIKRIAKVYGVSEQVVRDLLDEGFNIKEAEEIIYEAEY